MSEAGTAPPDEITARSPTLRLSTQGPLFDAQAGLTARLQFAFPPRQFQHVRLPARPTKETWDRVTLAPRFIGLAWLGLQGRAQTGRIYHCDCEWLLYLGCKNQKPERLLEGDAYGVGQLGLTGMAVALINGWVLPGIGAWSVKSVDNAALDTFINEETGIVALQISCALAVVDAAAAAALPEFLATGAEWALPPIGVQTVDDVRIST